MDEPTPHIEAFDCLPFDTPYATADVLQEFIESQSGNIFWFTPDYRIDTETKLAEYDYRSNKWIAGRFIGEAFFEHNNQPYKITIKPRFGEKVLLRMLEEIFNIRITESTSEHSKDQDWQHYIKRIIAFIWVQKLANANLHGLPKVSVRNENKGLVVKGRIEVRKTIKTYYQSKEVVSSNRIKQVDPTIAQIINQAYNIIKADFPIGKVNVPDAAQDAINHISSDTHSRGYIPDSAYKGIRYKDIYLSWKPIVDFSWDLIKRKRLSLKQNKAKKGYGFFIDMAEVWEQYLRTTLKKRLLPHGWHLQQEKITAYKNQFYQRELIPDLVFQNQNEVAVWDAKYKRMLGRQIDVDRSDFFQIHTYIQNFLRHKKVKAGGLLYPISTEPDFDTFQSPYLLNEEGIRLNFSIDGIILKEIPTEKTEREGYREEEDKFINRIINSLQ